MAVGTDEVGRSWFGYSLTLVGKSPGEASNEFCLLRVAILAMAGERTFLAEATLDEGFSLRLDFRTAVGCSELKSTGEDVVFVEEIFCASMAGEVRGLKKASGTT